MLVTLADMKTYLGVADNSHDQFLTDQITYISEVIEGYCGRKFSESGYIQTFHFDDYNEFRKNFTLHHYPVSVITTIEEDSNPVEDVRLHKATGLITKKEGFFIQGDTLVVEYTAGYSNIPETIKQVVFGIVAQRYNKKVSGLSLDFGSDVQAISIPGVINVQFDYTLDSNQRKSAYGAVIGNYANMLDPYRSERTVIGSGKVEYVEDV